MNSGFVGLFATGKIRGQSFSNTLVALEILIIKHMASDEAQNIILDNLVTGFSLFPCYYLSIWEKVAKETNSECVFFLMDL